MPHSEILVPAEAEIVIEGRILPGVREPEGPFGEFPQYYGERGAASCHRGGCGDASREPDLPHHQRRRARASAARRHSARGDAAVASAAQLSRRPRRASAPGGVCRYHLHVQMQKGQRGRGEERDPRRLCRALRFEAGDRRRRGRRISTIRRRSNGRSRHGCRPTATWSWSRGAQGSRLDPSAADGVSAKMGLDATIPLDTLMQYKRIRVPGEQAVDLDTVLSSDPATSWRSEAE